MVASGAFATISIDDTTIGAMTAEMAAKYLDGAQISEIPSVVVDDVVVVINKATADAIGVTVAQDVLDKAKIIEK